jgi:hypothetical protein
MLKTKLDDDKQYMLRKEKRVFKNEIDMCMQMYNETKALTTRQKALYIRKELWHYSPSLMEKVHKGVLLIEDHFLQEASAAANSA